jgi:hypothetical protein
LIVVTEKPAAKPRSSGADPALGGCPVKISIKDFSVTINLGNKHQASIIRKEFAENLKALEMSLEARRKEQGQKL